MTKHEARNYNAVLCSPATFPATPAEQTWNILRIWREYHPHCVEEQISFQLRAYDIPRQTHPSASSALLLQSPPEISLAHPRPGLSQEFIRYIIEHVCSIVWRSVRYGSTDPDSKMTSFVIILTSKWRFKMTLNNISLLPEECYLECCSVGPI